MYNNCNHFGINKYWINPIFKKLNYKGNFYSDANGNHVKKLDVATLTTSNGGRVVVSAAQGTAGSVTITFSDELSNIKPSTRPVIVTVTRAGIDKSAFKLTVTDATLKVETNGTDFVLTSGDIINYIVM